MARAASREPLFTVPMQRPVRGLPTETGYFRFLCCSSHTGRKSYVG